MTYSNNEHSFRTSFDNYADYQKAYEAAQKAGKSDIRGYDKTDSRSQLGGFDKNFAAAYAALEDQAFQAVRGSVSPEVFDEFTHHYTPGAEVFQEIVSQGMERHFLKRKLVAGREDLDMLQGTMNYLTGMARSLAKGYTKESFSLALRDQSLLDNPKLRNLAQDYIGTQIDAPADGPLVRGMKQGIFHYFLGSNLSSLVVVATHPMAVLAPWLTRQGAGVVGSYKLLGKANAELIGQALGKPMSDPELAKAMESARERGVIDKGILSEFTNNEDLQYYNLRNFATGDGSVLDAAKMLAKPLYWWGQWTKSLFNGAAGHNSRVAFASAYMLGKSQGMDSAQAAAYAEKSVPVAAFTGGQANRPVGMFANSGKFHGAVSLLYSLQTFQAGSIATMSRLFLDSIGQSGLKGSELQNAKKAFGQMVATQVAMSGVFGLPVVGAVAGVVQQMFPQVDFKRDIRKTLQGLTGDDKSLGYLLSDAASNGLPNAMLPFDTSTRLSLGHILGVNSETGFHYSDLAGPAGSIAQNMVEGVQQATQGNFAEAGEKFVPTGLKNVMRLAAQGGRVSDASGRQVYSPSDSDKLLLALGFRPSALAHAQEELRMQARATEVQRRDLSMFHQSLVQGLQQGDIASVRSALLERQGRDPTYDARAGARRVVEEWQAQQVPKLALLRGRQAGGVQSLYPSANAPAQSQLYLQRKQMEGSLGLPGVGQETDRELSYWQVVDGIMQRTGVEKGQAEVLAKRALGMGQSQR